MWSDKARPTQLMKHHETSGNSVTLTMPQPSPQRITTARSHTAAQAGHIPSGHVVRVPPLAAQLPCTRRYATGQ